MNKKVYLTTTLPYVNSLPHIGFALEIIQADIFARYNKLIGNDVFFNTGTDEHGQKIHDKAIEAGKDTQKYVDEYAEKFKELENLLGLDGETLHFIRTTDKNHIEAAQEFWKRCDANGDIYKKLYKVKYCVGCELEKTDSELVDGKCALHPNKELEIREEENYFFKFSNYKEELKAFYEKNPAFILPNKRFNSAKQLVSENGLDDFSISRLKEKMSWGVPVPGDDEHVMYVWFDALVNYISAIGWPSDEYKDWWPVIQFAGKDQVKQQGVMWQAMLMSAGVETSKQIVIHGFVTSDGKKMSKSLGNVVNPTDLVGEYGTDALRYYIARHMHPFEDSDFTMEKFKEAYTANLVNGIGNLTSRIMKMAEDYGVSLGLNKNFVTKSSPYLNTFNIHQYTNKIWAEIQELDEYIQKEQPFKKIKINEDEAKNDLKFLISRLNKIAVDLKPIMPETSKKILKAIKENKKPDEPLFPRK